MLELAHGLVRDGEGATKFVTVQVARRRNRCTGFGDCFFGGQLAAHENGALCQ